MKRPLASLFAYERTGTQAQAHILDARLTRIRQTHTRLRHTRWRAHMQANVRLDRRRAGTDWAHPANMRGYMEWARSYAGRYQGRLNEDHRGDESAEADDQLETHAHFRLRVLALLSLAAPRYRPRARACALRHGGSTSGREEA